jgi:hypothetical protein
LRTVWGEILNVLANSPVVIQSLSQAIADSFGGKQLIFCSMCFSKQINDPQALAKRGIPVFVGVTRT